MNPPLATIRRALAASALAAALGAVGPAWAQDGAGRAVVQPLPPPETGQLSQALQRLAANPRDLEALIAAGNASLKLDDVDAALGFFARAEEVAPNDARATAGRAAAMVKDENPFDALRLFEQAERAGAPLNDLESERALAYDLVGDNAQAQQLYREVLARGEDAETSRRLAVSLAISGDQAGMERVLLPMLQRRDLAAYRARAFALAILGKVDEASTITDAVMPKPMAAKMAPYLRYMPRLTHAQQAAAANLGNFPRTADIGHDDARLAHYGAAAPAASGADARLVPTGEPLGPAPIADEGRRRPDKPEGEAAVVAQAAPVPEPVALAQAEPEPAPSPPAAPEPSPEQPAVTKVALAEPPRPALSITAPAPAPVTTAAAEPAFDLAQVAGSAPVEASPPEPAPAALADAAPAEPPSPGALAAAPPPVERTPMAVLNGPAGSTAVPPPAKVADAFADFQLALSPATPAAGAVDLSTIAAPRERAVKEEVPAPAKPAPKTAPPKSPARHWVQLATGKDRARLGTDFRRIVLNSKNLLKDSKGFLARWNETNRLLTGPFKSDAAAQALVTKLDDAGIKAFTFDSAEGEDVAPLAGK